MSKHLGVHIIERDIARFQVAIKQGISWRMYRNGASKERLPFTVTIITEGPLPLLQIPEAMFAASI